MQYSIIDSNELYRFKDIYNSCSISESDFLLIKERYPIAELAEEDISGINLVRIHKGKMYKLIVKLEDEWFITPTGDGGYFYKCDQIDGLMECLNETYKY